MNTTEKPIVVAVDAASKYWPENWAGTIESMGGERLCTNKVAQALEWLNKLQVVGIVVGLVDRPEEVVQAARAIGARVALPLECWRRGDIEPGDDLRFYVHPDFCDESAMQAVVQSVLPVPGISTAR